MRKEPGKGQKNEDLPLLNQSLITSLKGEWRTCNAFNSINYAKTVIRKLSVSRIFTKERTMTYNKTIVSADVRLLFLIFSLLPLPSWCHMSASSTPKEEIVGEMTAILPHHKSRATRCQVRTRKGNIIFLSPEELVTNLLILLPAFTGIFKCLAAQKQQFTLPSPHRTEILETTSDVTDILNILAFINESNG